MVPRCRQKGEVARLAKKSGLSLTAAERPCTNFRQIVRGHAAVAACAKRRRRKQNSDIQFRMTDLAVYAGLFMAALVAATIFPMQSEAALAGLALAGYSPALLLIVASIGNILGSVINWMLGRGIEHFRDRSWFPATPAALARAQRWYQRYGKWSLLLSWVPIIGDPLTLIAGVMREPLPVFLLLVTIAKVGRYIAVLLIAQAFV